MTVLAPRKLRRAEARKNKVRFEPAYNGPEPVRGKNRDVRRREIREIRRSGRITGDTV
jgi:hypothetical protein